MISHSRRRAPHGFTLVGVLVSVTLVALVATISAKMLSQTTRTAGNTDKGVRADEVMVRAASRIMLQDFETLTQITCAGKWDYNGPTNCLSSDLKKINPALAVQADAPDERLEIARDFDGKPLPEGPIKNVCVELRACRWVAGGQAAQVDFRVWWRTDPVNDAEVQGRTLALRRSRW